MSHIDVPGGIILSPIRDHWTVIIIKGKVSGNVSIDVPIINKLVYR